MTDSPKPVMRPYRKHILICGGSKCAAEDAGIALFQWLKQRLAELKLTEGPDRILRSQCKCFGICKGGPLAVVYPEGVWYYGLDAEKMEKIIQRHLIGGTPAAEYVFHPSGDGNC